MRFVWRILGGAVVTLLILTVVVTIYLFTCNYYGSRRDEQSRKITHDYLLLSNAKLAKGMAEVLSNKDVLLNFLYQESVRNGYLGRKYSDFNFGAINYVGERISLHPRLGMVSGYINEISDSGESSIQLGKDGKILPVIVKRFTSISSPKFSKF